MGTGGLGLNPEREIAPNRSTQGNAVSEGLSSGEWEDGRVMSVKASKGMRRGQGLKGE